LSLEHIVPLTAWVAADSILTTADSILTTADSIHIAADSIRNEKALYSRA
jgi:hypothetical protein